MNGADQQHGFAGGGYFVARPGTRTSYMNATLLPEQIVSASDHIATIVPGVWALDWPSVSDEERLAGAAKARIADEEVAATVAWCTDAFDRGELAWPGVFPRLSDALRARRERFPGTGEFIVFGIALPREARTRFLDENPQQPGVGEFGVVACVRDDEPPASGGDVLGFDVLGWDHGGFCSYLCNGLETPFAEVLGVRPNGYGLIDRFGDAQRCAAYCGEASTRAEPGLWLPWRLTRYDDDE